MTSACTRVKQISLALTDVKKLGVSEQEKEVARPSSKRTHIIIAPEQVMTSFASNPFSKYRSLFPTLLISPELRSQKVDIFLCLLNFFLDRHTLKLHAEDS